MALNKPLTTLYTLCVLVLEAQLPIRKKKTMEELTEALQGLKVAQEMHAQFEEHLRKTQQPVAPQPISTATSIPSDAVLPPPTWSAPSKTLENQMRKVFRLIGSDDSKSEEGRRVSTLVNDVQSGKAQKRDLLLAVSKTYESERKNRMAETRKQLAETRSYHLRRIQQQVARLPGEYEDPDDEMVRMLELVSEENALKQAAPSEPSPKKRPVPVGGLQLPVVHSSKKLKEMEEQRKAEAALEAAEYINFFYVLDDDSPLAELGEFDSVQYVPIL